jgi:hypothetical protein
VANRPMCAKPFVSYEVDRWSTHCTYGYRSTVGHAKSLIMLRLL